MKCVFLLLCAIGLAQARSTALQTLPGSEAQPGENPWVVYIRVATNSGTLRSCVGTFLHHIWVITAASCVKDARVAWARFGMIEASKPEVIEETMFFRRHWSGVALLNLENDVPYTDTIRPAKFTPKLFMPAATKYCGFANTPDGSDEVLRCHNVDNGKFSAEDYDIAVGSGLINDEKLVAVVTGKKAFVVTLPYVIWIWNETDTDLTASSEEEDEEEETTTQTTTTSD